MNNSHFINSLSSIEASLFVTFAAATATAIATTANKHAIQTRTYFLKSFSFQRND